MKYSRHVPYEQQKIINLSLWPIPDRGAKDERKQNFKLAGKDHHQVYFKINYELHDISSLKIVLCIS